MKQLAGMTWLSQSRAWDSAMTLLSPAAIHVGWYQGGLPGTGSIRKSSGSLWAQDRGILRCFNDITPISSSSG